jgi:hypothetical protein
MFVCYTTKRPASNRLQHKLCYATINFFYNSQWPANSPDLNAAETVGAIVKQRVEEKCF